MSKKADKSADKDRREGQEEGQGQGRVRRRWPRASPTTPAPAIRSAAPRAGAGSPASCIAAYLSYKAGVPTFDVGLRALVAGIVGYMLAWMCAVTVWRHLVLAELRAAVERTQRPGPRPDPGPRAEARRGRRAGTDGRVRPVSTRLSRRAMDPIHPIVPVSPNIPPVAPAPSAGRVDRDGARGDADADKRRRKRPDAARGPRRRRSDGIDDYVLDVTAEDDDRLTRGLAHQAVTA